MGEGGSEMFQSMILEMPIGTLANFGMMGMEEVKALIDVLNK